MRALLLALPFVMTATWAWGQTLAKVEGVVVDTEGKPLSGVTAALAKARLTALSGTDGSFRLDLSAVGVTPRLPDGKDAVREPAMGTDLLGREVPVRPYAWTFLAFRGSSPAGALAKGAVPVDTLSLKAEGFAPKAVILDGYEKSLGRIELAREAGAGDSVLYRASSLEVRQNGTLLTLRGPTYTVRVDLAAGVYHVQSGGRQVISRAFSDVLLEDGRRLQGTAYASHLTGRAYLEPLQDGFGKGLRATVEHRGGGLPVLKERFHLYEEKAYFLVEVEVSSAQAVGTNSISPLTILPGDGAGIDLGAGTARVLSMPWDNDKWQRHRVHGSGDARESYGAAAVFDGTGRQGLVIGAVTHDLWKTGLRLQGIGGSKVAQARIYGGAAGSDTRDTGPHGMVRGLSVASPRILVGFFSDWRNGLEEYGRACAAIAPLLAWDKGVPFGWNSWSAMGSSLNMESVIAASDFLKKEVMDKKVGFGGEVYVNMDSYWDNLDENALRETARRIHANGQKAGIYWTPFTYWGTTAWHETQTVDGTGGKYKYGDIFLRDSRGVPVPAPAGGMVLDVSHPGTLARIDWQLQRFVDWGYEFVKLDFVTYGALEGVHYDKSVPTGVAAYNIGMQRIVAALAPGRIGRPFFIHLSIAPLFPHQYAHARRISCDVFGRIGSTEYLNNALTGAWWQNGTLYNFNDPDHTVLFKSFNEPATSEAEARSRLHASIIGGTMMLMGDDLRDSTARDRYRRLLTDPGINALAARGKSFRPAENDTGDKAAELFVLEDKEKGDFHAALFNYGEAAAVKSLSPARLGLPAGRSWRLYDMWSKTAVPLGAGISVSLPAAESRLYRVEPAGP